MDRPSPNAIPVVQPSIALGDSRQSSWQAWRTWLAKSVPPGERLSLSIIWPRAGQWVIAFLLGTTSALLAIHTYGLMRWATRPTSLEPGNTLRYRVDINRADRAELLQLPGVGNSLATQIEDHRRQYGAFKTVDDLAQVHGIGLTTLQRLRPWVRVADDPDFISQAAERTPVQWNTKPGATKPAARAKGPSKQANLLSPIDVNAASAQELQQLPGIGPAKAQRIVEERERKPFQSIEDLRRVSGIGAKTLERLRPYITVEANPRNSGSSTQIILSD
jgi:competence protein ComEA